MPKIYLAFLYFDFIGISIASDSDNWDLSCDKKRTDNECEDDFKEKPQPWDDAFRKCGYYNWRQWGRDEDQDDWPEDKRRKRDVDVADYEENNDDGYDYYTDEHEADYEYEGDYYDYDYNDDYNDVLNIAEIEDKWKDYGPNNCITEILVNEDGKNIYRTRWSWSDIIQNNVYPKKHPPKRQRRAALLNLGLMDYDDGEQPMFSEEKYKELGNTNMPDKMRCDRYKWVRKAFPADGEKEGQPQKPKSSSYPYGRRKNEQTRARWTDQRESENDSAGRIVIPYSFHWTFPRHLMDFFRKYMTEMENDFGCVTFKEVANATHNKEGRYNPKTNQNDLDTEYIADREYKHGILMTWLNDGCASGSMKGQTERYHSLNRRHNYAGPVDPCENQLRKPRGTFDESEGVSCDPDIDTDFIDDDKNKNDFHYNCKENGQEHLAGYFKFYYRNPKNQWANTIKDTWQYLKFADSCMYGGTVMHETYHALGRMHEQMAPDRDDYLVLKWRHNKFHTSRSFSAYRMINPKGHAVSPYPFDLDSLMLYGYQIFKCVDKGKPTISNKCQECSSQKSCKKECDCKNISYRELAIKWEECDDTDNCNTIKNDIAKENCYDKCTDRDGIYPFHLLREEFMDKDDLVKRNLWLKNKRRQTTTDALNMDWYFCKSTSYFHKLNENKEDPKYTINKNYIQKDTIMCKNPDRVGILQPVYKDRICDGWWDCHDGDDEDGTLGDCVNEHSCDENDCVNEHDIKAKQKSLEVDEDDDDDEDRFIVGDEILSQVSCPEKIMITHSQLDECTPYTIKTEDYRDGNAAKDQPAWMCWQGAPFRARNRIFWVDDLREFPTAAPFTQIEPFGGKQFHVDAKKPISGWVFSGKEFLLKESEHLWAFHQVDETATGSDRCPPSGKWSWVSWKLYDRVFSYPARTIKMYMPELVTVCGDQTGEFNGHYTNNNNNGQKIFLSSFDDERSPKNILFNEKNKVWQIYDPSQGPLVASYHSKGMQNQQFELINRDDYYINLDEPIGNNAHWFKSKNIEGSTLPGYFDSDITQWEDAPLGFGVHPGHIDCGVLNEPMEKELYVCNSRSEEINTIVPFDGRYELNLFDMANLPYYEKVRDLDMDASKFMPRIYIDYQTKKWMIEPEFTYGAVFKTDGSLFNSNWQGRAGYAWEDKPWQDSMLTIQRKPCLNYINDNGAVREKVPQKLLPKEIFICGGDSVLLASGKYERISKDLNSGLPYYHHHAGTNFIFWDSEKQRWIIDSQVGKPFGYYYKDGRDMFDTSNPWYSSSMQLRPDDEAVGQGWWRTSNIIATTDGRCPEQDVMNLPPRLFVCSETKFQSSGKYTLQWTDNVPYYKLDNDDNQKDRYLYWESTWGNWVIGWDINSKFGYYYNPSFNNPTASWIGGNLAFYFTGSQQTAFGPATDLYVTETNTCDIAQTVYICNAAEWQDSMNYNGKIPMKLVTDSTVNGAPWYQPITDLASLVIIWEGTAWMIAPNKEATYGYYYSTSGQFSGAGQEWVSAHGTVDFVGTSNWDQSNLYISTEECPDSMDILPYFETTSEVQPATTSTGTTSTGTTMEPATAFNMVCPEKGTMVNWLGSTGLSSLDFYGESSAIINVNIFNSDTEIEIWENAYVGFMTFTSAACGEDVIRAFRNERLSWGLVDTGDYYTAQFGFMGVSGSQNTMTLQFHRHSHSSDGDLGSTDVDQFKLVIDGLDKVDFEHSTLEECFTSFHVGVMSIADDIDPRENHAKCASMDYDF